MGDGRRRMKQIAHTERCHSQMAAFSRLLVLSLVPASGSSSRRRLRWFGLTVWLCQFQAGCGIHYYDRRTGKEHLWGIGHLQMAARPSTDSAVAVVTADEMAGVHIDAGGEDFGVSLGYENRRQITVSPSEQGLVLVWPTADFFNFRVGTNLPVEFLTLTNRATHLGK